MTIDERLDAMSTHMQLLQGMMADLIRNGDRLQKTVEAHENHINDMMEILLGHDRRMQRAAQELKGANGGS